MTAPKKPKRVGVVWVSGEHVDRSGIAKYIHLIMSSEDPEQLGRHERGRKSLNWLTDFHPGTYDKWRAAILKLLSDGQPRTFNRIVLELTGRLHAGEVAFGKAPDDALWDLVKEGEVSHTMEVPILFRKVRRLR